MIETEFGRGYLLREGNPRREDLTNRFWRNNSTTMDELMKGARTKS